ncbi:MAG: transposase [Candidatus Cryptobacteroides sp.]|nr:transposase [Candidatus Cryptobacteroides sp.]
MEKTTKRWSKRTFTPEFKMEVLSYHYTHGEHRSKTCEKYGISEASLRQWLKTYKVDKEGVSLQSELEKSFLMKQPQETDSQEAMKQRIAALEKALEYERMRCRGYEKLIEIAEKEEGISILKSPTYG